MRMYNHFHRDKLQSISEEWSFIYVLLDGPDVTVYLYLSLFVVQFTGYVLVGYSRLQWNGEHFSSSTGEMVYTYMYE